MDRYLLSAIDVNISIAYFWLNEGAHQASYSIFSLLDSIKEEITEASAVKRIEDLGNDIKIMNKSEQVSGNKVVDIRDFKNPASHNVPKKFSHTLELKILWITMEAILNLFDFGAYELAFMMLMEISEEWHLVYEMIIPNLKKTPMMDPLKDWSKMHLFFAIDLYGDDFLIDLFNQKDGV